MEAIGKKIVPASYCFICILYVPVYYYGGPQVVNRTYGTYQNPYISPFLPHFAFLLIIFGPIRYGSVPVTAVALVP